MVLDWIPTSRIPEPDLESASPALLRRRAIATVIDLVICYAVIETAILAVLMVAFTDFFTEQGAQAFLLSLVGLIPIYLLYSFLWEWKFLRTPGKKRMDVLVVEADGSPPGVQAAAVRNVLRYVDWLPVGYLLGWLLARRSSDGRRLGDRLAGTVVVRPRRDAETLYHANREFETESDSIESATE
ncbi:RDD family protein [Natrarchaeobaculum aegyptiacum]|uniref:RDD domain-containing protein n=1 Tax=Natrarchaeobaculum aegyptiacum TaxID=745377 RepID=A0A2Z2HSX3_9EURY|nr:RDD family protein [Natrarchaeobaculum aegyptiacum]ARS90269.1 hypothetical protein B1756_11400 [Natrarchaeobaculum aegyptiacum]